MVDTMGARGVQSPGSSEQRVGGANVGEEGVNNLTPGHWGRKGGAGADEQQAVPSCTR